MLIHNAEHGIEILCKIETYPIELKEYEDTRRLVQNARRWVRMTWLQNNIQPTQAKESWHYKLLIETGYIKTTVMTTFGNMKIEIPMPEESKKMGMKKFAEMEEKTDAYLAIEYGIEIPEESA